MPEIVYVLCMLTSGTCAYLLLRSYSASRSRLLLWSSLCFVGLALNNMLLLVDVMTGPQIDLAFVRNLTALAGLTILVFGLVWDSK